MIRRDSVSPEEWASICTPMDVVRPRGAHPGSGALYVGSWLASVDADLLGEHAIREIVEVHDGPWGGAPPPGIRLYRVALPDSAAAPLRPHLAGACAHIDARLRAGENVLVHCQQGISRSASIVIAYLIQRDGMTYDAALRFVKQRRVCVKPNPGFEKALREWEADVRRGRDTGRV